MSQRITSAEALVKINAMIKDGWNNEDIFDQLVQEGFTKKQIFNLFAQSGISQADEKTKNDVAKSVAQDNGDIDNSIEDALGGLLSMAIKYGLPILLLIFGVAYVGNEMSKDMAVGIRSAAAAIMPLAVTLAFAKSNLRHSTTTFLSDNKPLAFALAFALAMAATAGAMYMRQFDNVIPIGELAFSTTLSLMIFGNNRDGETSMLHVGAVSGFLTYVVLFGIPLSVAA